MDILTQNKRNFKQLTRDDRVKIDTLLKEHYTQKQIANIVGCSQSTISREIKRGSFLKTVDKGVKVEEISTYEASTAQFRCEARNKNSHKKPVFLSYPGLLKKIAGMFKKHGYSFEMIYGRINYLNELNDTDEFCPCVATLYTYLHKGYFEPYGLTKFDFPRIDIGRVNKPRPIRKSDCKGKSIHERPENINNRSEAFHWEIDLVVSSKNQGAALLTLTERKTRFELAFKIDSKESSNVINTLNSIEKAIGYDKFTKYFKTITSDNGSEFVCYKDIITSCIDPNKQRTEQYFADPYSSYQRGSNEAMNKCIRAFFPKKTKFDEVQKSQILSVVNTLNKRPKKCLKFQTSYEAIVTEDEAFKGIYSKLKKLIA